MCIQRRRKCPASWSHREEDKRSTQQVIEIRTERGVVFGVCGTGFSPGSLLGLHGSRSGLRCSAGSASRCLMTLASRAGKDHWGRDDSPLGLLCFGHGSRGVLGLFAEETSQGLHKRPKVEPPHCCTISTPPSAKAKKDDQDYPLFDLENMRTGYDSQFKPYR